MSQQQSPISKSDFDACGWQKLIEQCDKKDCQRYIGLFSIEGQKAQQGADAKAQEIFMLLQGMASLNFKLDNDQDPFGPMVTWSDGSRSFIAEDLTNEQILVLTEVVPEVADPEMQARMADVLYIRTRKPSLAGIAIYAYLAAAVTLMNPEHWTLTGKRIERALQLATKIGRNNRDYYPKTIQVIEELLGKYGDEAVSANLSYHQAQIMALFHAR